MYIYLCESNQSLERVVRTGEGKRVGGRKFFFFFFLGVTQID